MFVFILCFVSIVAAPDTRLHHALGGRFPPCAIYLDLHNPPSPLPLLTRELRAEVAGAFADGEGSEQAGLDKVLQHIDQVSDALLVYSAFLHDQGSTPDAAAADDNDAGEVSGSLLLVGAWLCPD